MSLHTYKISIKPNDNSISPTTFSMTDTTIFFTTNFTRSTHPGVRSSGRIDFSSNNLAISEVETLRNLFEFVEQTIGSYDNNLEALVQLEELNSDSNYVILLPYSHLETVHLNATNHNAGDYQTNFTVVFELFSSSLREDKPFDE